jgi:hypothetical protein
VRRAAEAKLAEEADARHRVEERLLAMEEEEFARSRWLSRSASSSSTATQRRL